MTIKLAKTEKIHFIGIGGIGRSGLALIMKRKGFNVQGSDISNNKNIERLKKNKIKVFIGNSAFSATKLYKAVPQTKQTKVRIGITQKELVHKR